MRVTVIGATGNIGTSVIERLAEEPAVDHIVGVARRTPDWHPPKTTFVAADVRTADVASLCEGSDVLVQLSWAFQPTHRPIETWNVNVLGTMRALEGAACAGVRTVVYASSVGSYSPAPGRTVDESWPTHSVPTAAYGREKAYVERILDAFELRHPNIRLVRVRPSFVFKRAAASEQGRIFAGALLPRGLVRPGRLPFVPLPAGIRFQAVHASDLADAFHLLVFSEARGAYNVASNPVLDAAMLADLMRSRPVAVPQALARSAVGALWRMHLVRADAALLDLFLKLPTLDTTKIRAELGWSPRWSGPDAVGELIKGVAEGAGGPTPPLHPPRNPLTVE